MTLSSLENTIITDLKAGVSWLEGEAETVGLGLWNVSKSIFIALEPQEAKVLLDVVQKVVDDVGLSKSIEQIETDILNIVKDEEKVIFQKIGSTLLQFVIAAVRTAIV